MKSFRHAVPLRDPLAGRRRRSGGIGADIAVSGSACGSLSGVRLLAQWPPDEPELIDHWLAIPPEGAMMVVLVRLAGIRWRIEHGSRELSIGLGLDHLEE